MSTGPRSPQDYSTLRRASYRVDAERKAAEQERADEREEQAEARRDAARREVVAQRRPARQDQRADAPSGGAVASRRSGLSRLVERARRSSSSRKASGGSGRGRMPASERPASSRAPSLWGGRGARARGSHGLRVPAPLMALLAIVVLYLVVLGPVDRSIALKGDEAQGLSRELGWHVPGMPYYVLALGSDARPEDTVSRTDTMILVRVDPLAAKLTMVSIPRDTKVTIEGQGTQKINAAYAFGGAAGAVRAVHELTGANISHVAVVRFDGLEQLVDYLGGITVDVPVEVYDPTYTGLVLPAGTQEMDGHTALLFSRTRYGFALGDYQRQIDQRIVLSAVMAKILTLSPLQLPGVVTHMGELVGTSMRMYSILPLMLRLKLAGSPTVYSATLPSEPSEEGGVSYVVVHQEEMEQMMRVVDAGGDPSAL